MSQARYNKSEPRLTKRQQRLADKGNENQHQKVVSPTSFNMSLRQISPMTENQGLVFDAYEDEKTLCLTGCPGTGKTFLSIYLAMREIADKSSPVRKLIIVRSPQSSKQIGFLPGTEKEKLAVYEEAYRQIFSDLYGRGDAYEILKQKGIVHFTGTSFMRGVTLDNAVILMDEVQNMSYQEQKTVATRLGSDSRLVICGDIHQDDLSSERYKETSGLPQFLRVLKRVGSVSVINFLPKDIVRSGFVRAFITAEYELGYI